MAKASQPRTTRKKNESPQASSADSVDQTATEAPAPAARKRPAAKPAPAAKADEADKTSNPAKVVTVNTVGDSPAALRSHIFELNKTNERLSAALAEQQKANEALKVDHDRHIIMLNQSLIAQQNYASAAIRHALEQRIEALPSADRFEELNWVWSLAMRLGLRRAYQRLRAYRVIKAHNGFDARFYARQTGQEGRDPNALLREYVTDGYEKLRDPNGNFSVSGYFFQYPDVRAAGIEPYSHFLAYGSREHRAVASSKDAEAVASNDSLMRFYGVKPPASAKFDPEERGNHSWPIAQNPKLAGSKKLGLYDFRPEDDVPLEGTAGDAFMKKFALLGQNPDFAGAVEYLNTLRPDTVVYGDDARPIDASIVIPVYGQLNYTLNCLHSLLTHTTRYRFEILIGDDQSPDSSPEWLPKLVYITYVGHTQNGGFIENCNLTAKPARGRILIMLNNDTRVVEGWLDGLVQGFELFPKAGLIGSKLFYSDGALQEAGGIVWQNGSAWNYGRNDDPNRPRYCYARQIDYVSGCSIAIPTKLWRELKGFDVHYKPAYYEDTDMCFRIRAAGYETWLQPLSRIIHYEGKTSGTDTGNASSVKSYQVTNQKKFFERWKTTLQAHRPNAEAPWLERDRKIKRRVLVIDACNPTPMQDAGSVATVNLIKYYQALGYHVTFVPEDNFLYQRDEVRALQGIGVECLYAPYELGMEAILKRYGPLYDVVQVIRAGVAAKVLALVQKYAPKAKIVYLNADLHYLRMERQAVVENRPGLLEEAAAMKSRELDLTRRCGATLVHSDVEKDILNAAVPEAKVITMPLIDDVKSVITPPEQRRDIMFLGGYNHPPNTDAALWIIDEIWPALSEQIPEARLLLVGSNPPKALLDKASDRIIVTGMVEDLTPWFERSRVFMAALRYGAGAKGKVLASLSHGLPVVATDIAIEGFPLEEGKTVWRANTAEAFVEHALKLYNCTPEQWRIYSEAGLDYIDKHHSFSSGVRALDMALKA